MWGVAIRTTDGFKRVGAVKSARLVHRISTSSSTGSVTIAGFAAARGFIFAPRLVASSGWGWDESSKTFSWSAVSGGFDADFYLRSS